MAVTFGSAQTVLSSQWTAFKSLMSGKGMLALIQYDDDGSQYTIFGIEQGTVVYTTTIWKGPVPNGVIEGGYTQGTNDTDKADFENNYKPSANAALGKDSAIVIGGYTTTTGTTNTAVMASTYTEQATNARRSLVSSSANDASAGTGARTVRVTYYDQTMAGPFTEVVTMNGTTPVDTVATNICFIEELKVASIGAGGGNAGTISLKSTTGGGGVTVGSIIVGDNQTNWAHHYVATGKTTRISQILGNIKGPFSGFIRLRKFTPTVANSADYVIAPALRVRAGSQDHVPFPTEIWVQGPARLVLYAQSDGSVGTQDWTAGFTMHEA